MQYIQAIDNYIVSVIPLFRNDFLNTFFIWVTDIGGPYSMFVLCFIFLVVLWINNKPRHFTLFLVGMITVNIVTTILKDYFDRLRPIDYVIKVGGYAFPSGHSSVVTFFMILIYFSYKEHIKSVKNRIVFGAILTIFALLVCFSRIYLGVHYLSDVLGGIALGIVLAYIGIYIFNRIDRK